MKSRWKSFRYRLEYLGLRFLAAFVPRLPRPIAYRLGRGAGALAARFDRHGWEVALTNLGAAFGERFSPAEREQIARESYRHFASTMFDLFWSPRLTKDSFRQLIEFQGIDSVLRTARERKPQILACAHYGNFEWASLGSGWAGLESHLITQEFKNPLLDPIFNFLRGRPGHEIVARDRGVVRLYRILRRGGSVGILVDLALQLHQPTVVIDCFGLKTSVTFAHAWLAARTGAAIVPVHAEPLPGGRCRVIFHPPLEIPAGATHQQIAQLCWNRFEPIVRQNPAPWLWMYKYWRYQPENPERPYPSYARPNPRFDALIAEEKAKVSR